MQTIKTVAFTAVMFAAVGVWAVASIKADARYSVPTALALEQVDVIQLTLNAKNLPVQQFDAI
jgi:hypothetical protein